MCHEQVKRRTIVNRPNETASGSVLWARVGLIAVVACLLIFGLVMLYSASSIYSYNATGDYGTVFFKQMVFVAVGLVLTLLIAIIPYHRFSLSFSAIALIATIPLLALVLIEGDAALGARRWIDLGFTTLQPSEFSKIAIMLVLAHLVDRCRNEGYSGPLIFLMFVACVIPVGLIIVEPDLGTTIIAVVGILAVLWFGGVPKRIVGVLAIVMVVMAVFAVVGTGFRQTRITSWLDPESDPLGSGYQLLNSYYAFGGGGIFGVGLGLSRQKFSWLPQSENDFLFAIVGEELGLIGALMVVALFMALVIMALRIAANAPDALGAMIAGASGVTIGTQAFLNMLCVVGALPTTGKPLPFFSAGGSSVITTMILVGLILSVSLQSTEASVYDFRREQFTMVEGGQRQGAAVGGRRSVLSRLPQPAAVVSGLPFMPAIQNRKTPTSDKVVPISRGRAERNVREMHAHDRYASEKPMRGQVQSRTNQSPVQAVPTKVRAVPMQARTAQAQAQVVPMQARAAQTQSRVAQTQTRISASSNSNKRTAPRPAQEYTRRRAEAPLSMASLRRNRVKTAGGGGRPA